MRRFTIVCAGLTFAAFATFATGASAQGPAAPPAPWRGAGPTPCVGADGGVFSCPPAPKSIVIRAGHLFDSKSGQMLANQVVVQNDRTPDAPTNQPCAHEMPASSPLNFGLRR